MKSKIFCLLLATGMTMTTAMAATDCATTKGNMTVQKVTMGCLNVTGSGNFTRTTLTGHLNMIGPLKASMSTLDSIQVAGPVKLDKTTVNGLTQIQGSLDASDSHFANKIQITAVKVILHNSTTQEITIQSPATATVELSNTTVNGDIIFVNKNGVVKSTHSTITGKIIGGKLI